MRELSTLVDSLALGHTRLSTLTTPRVTGVAVEGEANSGDEMIIPSKMPCGHLVRAAPR